MTIFNKLRYKNMLLKEKILVIKKSILLSLIFFTQNTLAFTANSISIQYEKPFYFIHIFYTITNFKEARRAHIRFHELEKEEIISTYMKLKQGAEFYFDKQEKLYFPEIEIKPDPW